MIAVDVDPLPDRAPLFSRPSYVSLSNLKILLWLVETHTFWMLKCLGSVHYFLLQSSSNWTSAVHFTSLQFASLNPKLQAFLTFYQNKSSPAHLDLFETPKIDHVSKASISRTELHSSTIIEASSIT
jgi:hypothetical protein